MHHAATADSARILDEKDAKSFLAETDVARHADMAGARTAGSILIGASDYVYHAARLVIFTVAGAAAIAWHTGPAAGSLFDDEVVLVAVIAKLTMWALLWEICGFATMAGPLGAGHSMLTPLRMRLTPGTLKLPLLAAVPVVGPRLAGRRRTWLDVAVFVVYTGSLVAGSVVAPLEATRWYASVSFVLLTILILLDKTAWTGSMGAYYYPLLACLGWQQVLPPATSAAAAASRSLHGLRLVQFLHLFIPGLAKLGPWFAHVSPTMISMCPLLPRPVRLALFKDPAAGDLTPNFLARCIGMAGAVSECLIPALWWWPATLGIATFGAAGMHAYIMACFPIGSVLEWNLFNLVISVLLFGMPQLSFTDFPFVGSPAGEAGE
eukprot:g5675.t1